MLSHSELVEAIRGFALLYLEIEAARRPARTRTPYVAAGLVSRRPRAAREPVTGTLTVGGVDYTLFGDHAIRAVEAPDRALMAGL